MKLFKKKAPKVDKVELPKLDKNGLPIVYQRETPKGAHRPTNTDWKPPYVPKTKKEKLNEFLKNGGVPSPMCLDCFNFQPVAGSTYLGHCIKNMPPSPHSPPERK